MSYDPLETSGTLLHRLTKASGTSPCGRLQYGPIAILNSMREAHGRTGVQGSVDRFTKTENDSNGGDRRCWTNSAGYEYLVGYNRTCRIHTISGLRWTDMARFYTSGIDVFISEAHG